MTEQWEGILAPLLPGRPLDWALQWTKDGNIEVCHLSSCHRCVCVSVCICAHTYCMCCRCVPCSLLIDVLTALLPTCLREKKQLLPICEELRSCRCQNLTPPSPPYSPSPPTHPRSILHGLCQCSRVMQNANVDIVSNRDKYCISLTKQISSTICMHTEGLRSPPD